LLKDTKSISATQEELIRDEMEEITINEEAGDAEVIDRNTNVDHETIKKWRSLIVTDDYGNEHNKHFLVRSFFFSAWITACKRCTFHRSDEKSKR